MECEWGSVGSIGVWDTVKMYDSEGHEVEIPKCDKCLEYKSQVIGKEAFAWVCNRCATNYEGRLVYKPPTGEQINIAKVICPWLFNEQTTRKCDGQVIQEAHQERKSFGEGHEEGSC